MDVRLDGFKTWSDVVKYRTPISNLESCGLVTTATQWRTQEFCLGRGCSTNSVKDRAERERGSGGGSPLVRGSVGSCNLVQETIHIVKFS